MRRPLDRETPRAGERDVPALQGDLALPGGEGDAVLGEHTHFIGGALHRDVLVGPELLGVGVGAQAQGGVGGNGLDAARVGVEAGGLAADGAQRVRGREVGVALGAQGGVLAAEEAQVFGADEGRAARGVKVKLGAGEGLDGILQGAAARLGLAGILAVEGGGQLAAGAGVHGVGVRHPGLAAVTVAVMVAAQAERALLAGAVAEGLAQLPAGAQLGDGLAGVHLGAGHAAALRGAGGGAQQHALASAHHGPNFILGDFK